MTKNKDSDNPNNAMASKEATQEEIDRFDLGYYLSALMIREPFFAGVMRIVTKIKTDIIPTAGVSTIGRAITMYWNPKFLASLNEKEVIGLLKHECYHLVFEHTTKRALKPHKVHNYAADLAINCLIDKTELPEGGLIPGEKYIPLEQDVIDKFGAKAASSHEKVGKLISSLPKNESTEWYFTKLMEDPEIAESIENRAKTLGKSLSQALADGDLKIDEDGNLTDADGNPVTLVPGTSDDHDGWGDGGAGEQSEEDGAIISGQIKDAIRKVVNDCDSNNSWGSVSAETKKVIRLAITGEISWTSVLKKFCGTNRRADRSSSIRRLNRKYPGIHPGNYKDYKASIAIYLDQSGSVSDEDLKMLGNELTALSKKIEFTLFNFDTSVDENSERAYKKNSFNELERTRSGGTNFTCVQVHANKNKKRFDGYLVLTDGYAPNPKGANRLKRGWVITPDGELQFPPSARDFVIKMKGKG